MSESKSPQPEEELTESRVLQLLGRPSVSVPLVTLWLYIVATRYLAGYLEFYGARTHWFDLGPLQLIAFSLSGVFNALLIAALLLYIWEVYPRGSREFWIPFGIWGYLFWRVYSANQLAEGISLEGLAFARGWKSHVPGVLLLLAPLVWRLRYLRDKKQTAREVEVLEGLITLHKRQELGKRFGVPADESDEANQALKSEAGEVLDRWSREAAGWMSRFARLVVIGYALWFAASLSEQFGRIQALREYAHERLAERIEDGRRLDSTRVLLSDGDHLLFRTTKGGVAMTGFSSRALSEPQYVEIRADERSNRSARRIADLQAKQAELEDVFRNIGELPDSPGPEEGAVAEDSGRSDTDD